MTVVLKSLSQLAIPLFIVFVLGYGFLKGIPVYEVFVEGAKEGFTTVIRILPYLVAMLVAIAYSPSGAMELMIRIPHRQKAAGHSA